MLRTYAQSWIKRELFGDGPWVDEPDRVEWRDGPIVCLVRRSPLGCLLGYAGVPESHPWFEMRWDVINARVHGGLTYASLGDGEIGHTRHPDDIAGAYWFVGFDCCHAFDYTPWLFRGIRPIYSKGWAYRDMAYVLGEASELALQARLAAGGDDMIAVMDANRYIDVACAVMRRVTGQEPYAPAVYPVSCALQPVVDALHMMERAELVAWLCTAQSELDGRTPAEVIMQGNVPAVLEMLRARGQPVSKAP
jgi:hypothetical protein